MAGTATAQTNIHISVGSSNGGDGYVGNRPEYVHLCWVLYTSERDDPVMEPISATRWSPSSLRLREERYEKEGGIYWSTVEAVAANQR